MLSHLSLGIADLDRSAAFYDAALGALGYAQVWRYEKGLGYGAPGGPDRLALFKLTDGSVTLAAGPGFHLAFRAESQDAVVAFYEAAMANGGTDNGAPGLRERYSPTYFAAFVIDPDGHKLEAVHQQA